MAYATRIDVRYSDLPYYEADANAGGEGAQHTRRKSLTALNRQAAESPV